MCPDYRVVTTVPGGGERLGTVGLPRQEERMPHVYRYENGRFAQFEKPVVQEQPMTIVANGIELATFLCTPVKLDYLTIGFLVFEGIIRGLEDVRDLDVDPENGVVEVKLATNVVRPARRVFTSGCGMGLTFTLRISHYPPLVSGLTLTAEQIFPLMQQLFDGATMYRASRGIHAAALSDTERVLLLAEDVGRHNALDKILGEAMMRGIQTAGRILLTSGRISSEMLRKGACMGTPFLISRTSPTTFSIEAAKRLGITVVGYVRRNSFNLYTHPERVLYGPPVARDETESVAIGVPSGKRR
jgi:FdhD protein